MLLGALRSRSSVSAILQCNRASCDRNIVFIIIYIYLAIAIIQRFQEFVLQPSWVAVDKLSIVTEFPWFLGLTVHTLKTDKSKLVFNFLKHIKKYKYL